MWFNFWVQNIHFIIEVFFAFIMLTSAWIFLDSWTIKKELKIFIRSLGFILLTGWAFLDAAAITFNFDAFKDWFGVIGFGLIFISLIMDPVPVRPAGIKTTAGDFLKAGFMLSLISYQGIWAKTIEIANLIFSFLKEPAIWQTLLTILITILIYIHYKKGLQIEWRHLFKGFLFLTLSALITILYFWKNSDNILIAQALADYQTVWIAEHFLKFIGVIFIGAWTWGFIRFRILPQLFLSLIALSFTIFTFTTIIYTGLLLNNIQEDAISSLKINAKTMELALREIKDKAVLGAKIVAEKSSLREAIRKEDKEALFKVLNNLMFENNADFMATVNAGGEVLMRGEDRDHFGDSLADDPVVWRALDGKSVVTAYIEPGVTVPRMTIRAASPIIDTSLEGSPEIIGATITGFIIDNAFVDGIQKLTGLDVTVFANDIRVATTFSVAEARLLGTRESNQGILNKVLKNAEVFTGTALVLNQPFYAAYSPLKDIEDTTIGMIFAGRPQISVIEAATNTIRLTFGVSILLMILVIAPIYFLARFIDTQQRV